MTTYQCLFHRSAAIVTVTAVWLSAACYYRCCDILAPAASTGGLQCCCSRKTAAVVLADCGFTFCVSRYTSYGRPRCFDASSEETYGSAAAQPALLPPVARVRALPQEDPGRSQHCVTAFNGSYMRLENVKSERRSSRSRDKKQILRILWWSPPQSVYINGSCFSSVCRLNAQNVLRSHTLTKKSSSMKQKFSTTCACRDSVDPHTLPNGRKRGTPRH